MILGKLICWWKGRHLRSSGFDVGNGLCQYCCPRCGRIVVRKRRIKRETV